jgi:hypothetical protein
MDEPLPKFKVGDRVVPKDSTQDSLSMFRVQGRTFMERYEGSTLTARGWMYFLLNEQTRHLARGLVGEELLQKAPSKGWDQEEIA